MLCRFWAGNKLLQATSEALKRQAKRTFCPNRLFFEILLNETYIERNQSKLLDFFDNFLMFQIEIGLYTLFEIQVIPKRHQTFSFIY